MVRKYVRKKDIPIVAEEEAIYLVRNNGNLPEVKFRPRLIDLFSGAGGMTLGFTKLTGHCFEPVWANDFNEYAANTYNRNFGSHCTIGDIVSILEDPKTRIPKADVVIGGPPCQGFSLLNKNREGDPKEVMNRFDLSKRAHHPTPVCWIRKSSRTDVYC